MLRWAGVSWEPKLLHFESFPGVSFRDSPGNPWSNRNWHYWENYSDSLAPEPFHQQSSFSRDPKLKKQCALEFFPECLGKIVNTDTLTLIRPLIRDVNNKRCSMHYTYNGRGNDRKNGYVESLAYYQVHKTPWLAAKPSVLFPEANAAPCAAYMPRKSLYGLLPEIDVAITDDQEGRDLASFLVNDLGVRDGVPGRDDQDWRQWLDKLPEALNAPDTARDHEIAIRALQKKILSFDACPRWLTNSPPKALACETWNNEREHAEIRFLRPNQIYYIDEPHLAAVQEKLVRHFPIFLLKLDEGRNAVEWFHLQGKLSAVVTIQPIWNEQANSPQATHIYETRKPALRALLQKELPSGEQLREVTNLEIVISQNGNSLARTRVPTWEADGIIMVDHEWALRGVAIAIARLYARPKLADLIENILASRDDEEVRQRLRDFGIPEEAIREATRESLQPGIVLSNVTQQPLNPADPPVPSPQPINLPTRPVPKPIVEVPSIVDANEEGRKAEHWLREALRQRFGLEYSVSDRPVRDSQNRETDILLTIENREIHIEVKRLEGRTIYWSDLEVSKAHEHQDRYYMALVSPTDAVDGYLVRWLWNPLSDLLSQPRVGIWLWGSSRSEVPLEGQTWFYSDSPPNRPADRFSFRIDVSDGFLARLQSGLDSLKEQLSRTGVGL
jgi:hypothetical protein